MQDNVITDIKIPFWRLVVIFVKWAIAAIPAAIIIAIIYAFATTALIGLISGAAQFPWRF
jgi:VIT1/CCC1 family predicted Fe2+/Mn2+ transporter